MSYRGPRTKTFHCPLEKCGQTARRYTRNHFLGPGDRAPICPLHRCAMSLADVNREAEAKHAKKRRNKIARGQ